MGFHNELSPGDTFVHSAERENAISRMLNRIDGFSAGSGSRGVLPVIRIGCYNPGTEVLPAGAVAFDPDREEIAGAVPVCVATDGSQPWGILETPLAPRAFGAAVVQGAVRRPFVGTQYPGYVEPDPWNPGGLRGSASGTARILFYGDGADPLLLLGGLPTEPAYAGFFKVIDAPGEDGVFKVRVVNGADPAASVCGVTDLGNVDAATLTPASGDTLVILKVEYDAARDRYRQTMATKAALDADSAEIVLATIKVPSGRIVQEWTGGTVYWMQRYYA